LSRRIERLAPLAREAVTAAITALETSDEAVSADHFQALFDPALKAVVTEELDRIGRVLLEVDGLFTSGYSDDVAHELTERGIGQLCEQDLAVLTIVLLHSIAIPRARGKAAGETWSDAIEFDADKLSQEWSNPHLTAKAMTESLRRLRDAGVLKRGHRAVPVPGPQFLRLTPARNSLLWENLVLLAAPDSMLSDVIRRRRVGHAAAKTI
jgi:hypothetical protein